MFIFLLFLYATIIVILCLSLLHENYIIFVYHRGHLYCHSGQRTRYNNRFVFYQSAVRVWICAHQNSFEIKMKDERYGV